VGATLIFAVEESIVGIHPWAIVDTVDARQERKWLIISGFSDACRNVVVKEIETMTLEELQKIGSEKKDAKEAVELRYSERKREIEEEVRVKLNDEFGADLNRVRAEYDEVYKSLQSEMQRIDVQESLEKLPYPEGTIMVGWTRNRIDMPWKQCKEWRQTGERAVLQVVREGDVFPSNIRWCRPRVGAVILRYFKKNGSLGLKWDSFRDYVGVNCWRPEGQVPPEVKE
jgi:hypothetical protein